MSEIMDESQQSTELASSEPDAESGNPFAAGTPQARDYETLAAWRDSLRARGVEESAWPNDTALRRAALLTSRGIRAVGELEPKLDYGLKPFVGDIAESLARADREASAPAEPAAGVTGLADPAVQPAAPDLPDTFDPTSFATYGFSSPEREPVGIALQPAPGGAVALTWPVYTDDGHPDVTIYRLVADDAEALWNPDRGMPVVASNGLAAVDTRPLTSAQRHYQVWCHTGPTVADAQMAQPRRHAEAAFVSPVRDFELREDSGRVIGQWGVWPGVRRVQVFRIPIEIGARGSGNPRYRILTEDDNLGGFVDAAAERGRRYLYSAIVEVEANAVTSLSVATGRDVLVSVVLQPVTDLSIEQNTSEDDPAFDLTWTRPPAGRVIVYRTIEAPAPGIEDDVQAEAALEQAGLGAENRLHHPVSAMVEGREGLRNVPWIADSAMAYFTPVTVLEGRAFVGAWQSSVRVGSIQDAILRERVDGQVLSFSWPQGADSVFVYTSSLGASPELAVQSEPQEISRDAYAQRGGFRFPWSLPAERGCTLHLVPSAFQRGSRHLGPPAALDYHGLLRIWYTSVIHHGRVRSKAQSVTVTLRADRALPVSPAFAIVYNPERLPLHIADGTVLSVRRVGEEDRPPEGRILPRALGPDAEGAGWLADLESQVEMRDGVPYFVRLFADLPPETLERVAVIDPPVANLRLQ